MIPTDGPCTRTSERGRCTGTIRYDRERSRLTAVDGVCDACQAKYVHLFGRWTPFPDEGPEPAPVRVPTR